MKHVLDDVPPTGKDSLGVTSRPLTSIGSYTAQYAAKGHSLLENSMTVESATAAADCMRSPAMRTVPR